MQILSVKETSMTLTRSFKIIGASVLIVGMASGTALAGDKKNCGDKHKTTAKKTQTQMSTPTVVLPAKAETSGYPATTEAKKMKKVYTFDEALAKCQKYGATDLQACIDKKTGRTPKS